MLCYRFCILCLRWLETSLHNKRWTLYNNTGDWTRNHKSIITTRIVDEDETPSRWRWQNKFVEGFKHFGFIVFRCWCMFEVSAIFLLSFMHLQPEGESCGACQFCVLKISTVAFKLWDLLVPTVYGTMRRPTARVTWHTRPNLNVARTHWQTRMPQVWICYIINNLVILIILLVISLCPLST